jgi:hypothetical protein
LVSRTPITVKTIEEVIVSSRCGAHVSDGTRTPRRMFKQAVQRDSVSPDMYVTAPLVCERDARDHGCRVCGDFLCPRNADTKNGGEVRSVSECKSGTTGEKQAGKNVRGADFMNASIQGDRLPHGGSA